MPEISVLFFSVIVVLIAGFVRGYSGFGFSMIVVVTLSLIFTPTQIVPVVLLLEIAASVWLMPHVWQQVQWRFLGWLFLGVAVGTPVGTQLLSSVSVSPMRAAIAITVMILSVMLWRGFRLKKMPGKGAIISGGMVSGVLNGSAAIGGPPVVLLFFSSPASVEVSRASLITFFLGTDIFATAMCAVHGLVTIQKLLLAVVLFVPLVLGLYLGNRSFIQTPPEAFRKKVLILLFVLSFVALMHSVLGKYLMFIKIVDIN
ncbi:MAG: sulfite exporter TauE/SafE family protein [Deltaproteobacteria bacterium]|nr:sulfite exporter TauE/SafE family protein [Deltaproteobacteria bacterium]